MTNLRSVGALLAISAVLSCATAINQEGGSDAYPTAGSDSGGSGGMVEEGGAPAGGSPQAAGGPSAAGSGGGGSAGKGGSGAGGKAGSGSGGSASGGRAGSGSGGRIGSGGTVGVAGSSGSSTGGKAGTSSGGAGGSAAGSDGTAGGGTMGPCDSPIDLPNTSTGNSGNFNTAGAVCYRTKATFNSLNCSNFDDRTIKVNGKLDPCTGTKTTFAPAIDGYNYFDVSAGKFSYASFGWYSS
jgi:endoglucanase